MTDSVKGISGAQGTSAGGNYSGGTSPDHHKRRSGAPPQSDLIEISQDARKRAQGNTKKSLVEYLKELLG